MTGCVRCGKDLSKVELIRAMEGGLYCSDNCALLELSAKRPFENTACVKDYYRQVMEVVTPQEIGLCEGTAPLNPVVAILMKRDGMSKRDAQNLVDNVREQIISAAASSFDAEDIIASELGLEPDYIFDILN